MVARWKPVHLGHAPALEALVTSADEVLIGLGSSNRYDVRNPFTAEESAEMIRRVVGPDAAIRLIPVPDLMVRAALTTVVPGATLITSESSLRRLAFACSNQISFRRVGPS